MSASISSFTDLTCTSFEGTSLSNDWRTINLLQLALQKMINVKTLRIINGHHNLTAILLGMLINSCSYRPSKIEHLWLESCSLAAIERVFPKDSLQLKTLRFRRMGMTSVLQGHLFSREDTQTIELFNGAGSVYRTPVQSYDEDGFGRAGITRLTPESLDFHCSAAVSFLNDLTYKSVPDAVDFLRSLEWNPTILQSLQSKDARVPDSLPLFCIISTTSQTLTSLTLDWLLTSNQFSSECEELEVQFTLFSELGRLNFPHLRALQLRNAVTNGTKLAPNIYLLHPTTVHSSTVFEDSSSHSKHIDMLGFMVRTMKQTSMAEKDI
jgi:hypothetical protein